MAVSFSRLQNAIINYARAKMPKEQSKAVIATVHGNSVTVQNKKYTADFVADALYHDGERVCCLLPENGRVAAVIGTV